MTSLDVKSHEENEGVNDDGSSQGRKWRIYDGADYRERLVCWPHGRLACPCAHATDLSGGSSTDGGCSRQVRKARSTRVSIMRLTRSTSRRSNFQFEGMRYLRRACGKGKRDACWCPSERMETKSNEKKKRKIYANKTDDMRPWKREARVFMRYTIWVLDCSAMFVDLLSVAIYASDGSRSTLGICNPYLRPLLFPLFRYTTTDL
ncbi:hypothetical protein BJX96DRAFT_114924 [Aspergillus floccosus]